MKNKGEFMGRTSVGSEAWEEYLISKNLAQRSVTSKMSDDELCEFYIKKIYENNLQDDAKKFVWRWCMDHK